MIRDTGERTGGACRAIAEGQLPAGRVIVLHEKPFARAVTRGYELADADGASWLFTLDADVLLTGDAIARLRRMCDAVEDEVFHVKGLLLCKVFGGVQPRGFHAFRGSLSGEALAIARDAPPSTKPENHVIRAMESRGHPFRFFADVLGVHDYEQSFANMYVKMLLRARKTGRVDELLARLRALAENDEDLRVATWGLEDGIADAAGATAYDWDATYPALGARLRAHGMREKPALTGPPAGYAERIIAAYRPTPHDMNHHAFAWSGTPGRWTLTDDVRTDPDAHAREALEPVGVR